MAISKQQVFEAADKLLAESGTIPILDAVRKISGGSYTTIGPWFAEWKAKQAADSAPRQAPVPPSIQTAAEGLAGTMWNEATSLAGTQLAAEREALAEAQRRLEQEKSEMAQIADRLTEEVDALKGALTTATTAHQTAAAQRDKLAGELSVTTTRATAVEARIAEMDARFQDLNHALQLTHAEQKAVREQHQSQVEALHGDLRQARSDGERARAELAKQKTFAEVARTQFEDAQKRSAADATSLKRAGVELEAARADVAKATAAASAAQAISDGFRTQLAQEHARFDTLAKAITTSAKPKAESK